MLLILLTGLFVDDPVDVWPAVVVNRDLNRGRRPPSAAAAFAASRGLPQAERVEESFAELLGHEAVEDKVDGGISDGHQIGQISQRGETFLEELIS